MGGSGEKRPEGMASKQKLKRKRKLKEGGAEVVLRPCKTGRVDNPEAADAPAGEVEAVLHEVEEGQSNPWSNLQLILSLQSKELDVQQKLVLAVNFVRARAEGSCRDDGHDYETVKVSRLIVFLSDWIQSLLISSGKKIKAGEKSDSNVVSECLDRRCWEIFKFCLEKSSQLHVTLNFSRNLLQPICLFARHPLHRLNDGCSDLEDSSLTSEDFGLYSIVNDCISLLFSSHEGMSNENLELWISTVSAVIELVNKVLFKDLEGGKDGGLILQFSSLVLQPFAKYLRTHPMRKDGFSDFVDKLLEPLLELLGCMHLHIEGSSKRWLENLLKLVGEVVSHGLFHPFHIDGFLTLHSTDKYLPERDGKEKTLTVIKSYHRHLFDKLEKITDAKNLMAVNGIGGLFHLFADTVKKHTTKAVAPEAMKASVNSTGSIQAEHDTKVEKGYSLVNLNAETRKSLFDFFVQITEPLLMRINCYTEEQMKVGDLDDIQCRLSCLRIIISSFIHEKVYIKTEDISRGACLGFLKGVYDTLISLANKFNITSSSEHDELVPKMHNLTAVAEELISALGCLLEIEYEVAGNDLQSLWSLMISVLALEVSQSELTNGGLLHRKILDLGCQLVNLYSELRQVNNMTFALCQALRLLRMSGDANKTRPALTSYKAYVKSAKKLLCSQDFKAALRNAVSSIPEGQASGCIRKIAEDVSESLMWLKYEQLNADVKESDKLDCKDHGTHYINLQCEVLGQGLSEIYSLVLDSLPVTRSNSTLVGSSMKDLMAIIRPGLNAVVGLPSQSLNEFLSYLTGFGSQDRVGANHEMSTYWALVFFFSVYMSCRSLSRQIISLMPPDSARKMCASLRDLLTAYPGKDLVEKTDWIDEGYFSWIATPSVSLHDVIESLSDVYLQSNVADSSVLIYQLHGMALQRIVDLNKMIKSASYVLQSTEFLLQSEVLDGEGQSVLRKKSRKWGKCISKLKNEAAGLTEFMMGYLTLLADDPPISMDTGLNFSVFSVNRRSFHTSIWWILCQNIDVWCSHANKKKLKMFLSILIRSSLPSVAASPLEVSNCNNSLQPTVVAVQQISFELLRDSTLFEHRFVRRHLASRFCKILEKSAVTLLGASSLDFDFSSSPMWSEILTALENSLEASRGKQFDFHPTMASSHSLESSRDDPTEGVFRITRKFRICQDLLRLLCWMPRGYLDSRSLKLYITCVLNIERLAVTNILDHEGSSKSCNYYELFKLFVCCRKALKHLVAAACDENPRAGFFRFSPLLSDGSFPFLWLLKSAYLVLGLRDAWAINVNNYVDTTFSVMDHTSYIFLTISKCSFAQLCHALIEAKTPGIETESGEGDAKSNSIQLDSHPDPSKDGEAWEHMLTIAHNIKEETQGLLGSLEDNLHDQMADPDGKHIDLSKLSYLVSCLSGYFWGLASALTHMDDKEGGRKVALLRRKKDFISKLNSFIDIYAEVVQFQLRILNSQSDKLLDSSFVLPSVTESPDANTFSSDVRGRGKPLKGVVRACLESPDFINDSSIANVNSDGSKVDGANLIPSISEVHPFELQILNKHLLQQILNGKELEAACLLRHLLIGFSALLRLNLQVGADCLSPCAVNTFLAVAQFLILELAKSSVVPEPFIFVSLDGVLKYLEELGHHLPMTDPKLSRTVYTRLVEMHLMAIGKCISLQGKKYTLVSHEMESNTKFLQADWESDESSYLNSSFCLDEFKARLRTSFEVLIRKSSELHLPSGVQAIERALVGVQVGCMANYDIKTGKTGGGSVSSYVAAGIDCFDMVLENVKGRKCLSVVRSHIQSLIAGLFNIILHLQSPVIFCEMSVKNSNDSGPDSGSVILMCIEVLTRVSGKHKLFKMEPWHVAQSLRIPAALFEDFSELQRSRASAVSDSISLTQKLHSDPEASVDRRFSVDIYAACCRLLYTVLKHHQSESEKCISQLQDSASALLHTLEAMDIYSVSRKKGFGWDVAEGIKCACSLRRIYEEMRQQKDVFGPHCFKLLANYVWVYSGFGPLKSGIRREIDEALRPGIYALIDACSGDDLQYLHTVFGEGPCRRTLRTLQDDYKRNFKFEGKI